MLLLGLSPFKNDTAAALVRDGIVEAAIEDRKLEPVERGIPEAAIQFCLKQGSLPWKDIDIVALANSPFRGWTRRSFSSPRLSLGAPVATAYQEGKEFGRFA